MKVAIHQPHYFPWLGYLNKMAKVDKFILMDDVQITDSSNMYRHNLLTMNGVTKYITIPFLKANYKNKFFNQLLINKTVDWQKNHTNFIRENYQKAPFYEEIWPIISFIFEKNYIYLTEVTVDTIILLKNIFNISTEIILQSQLNYPKESKKNQLVLDLCIAIDADYYLSGNGAKKYMELEPFINHGIAVEYQNFKLNEYHQFTSHNEFISGLSSLDILFNLGIEQSRAFFWENIH
ncbi:MAG TPA: WbqC family protein [Lutibacter sp.]